MSKKTIIILVLATVLVLIFGIGFWQWENSRNEKKEIAENQYRKVQLSNNDEQELNQKEESNLIWYEVPELGIRFKVDGDVAAGLIYEYKKNEKEIKNKLVNKNGSVLFSSKKLSVIVGCETSSGPLGTMSRLDGNPDDYEARKYLLSREYIKQFDGFFVVYGGAQSVCAVEKDMKKWDEYFENNPKFRGWIISAFENMETIR